MIDVTSLDVRVSVEDVKRVRVSRPKLGKLNPALYNIESGDTDDIGTDYATAGVSVTDEGEYRFRNDRHKYGQWSYDEDDSYMDFQEEEDLCSTNLDRKVMRTVTTNLAKPSIMKVYNAASANDRCTASEASDVLNEMDDYLGKALGDESKDEEKLRSRRRHRRKDPSLERVTALINPRKSVSPVKI